VVICVPYVVLEVQLPSLFFETCTYLLHVSLQNPVNKVIDVNVTDLITNYLRLPPYRDSLCTLK